MSKLVTPPPSQKFVDKNDLVTPPWRTYIENVTTNVNAKPALNLDDFYGQNGPIGNATADTAALKAAIAELVRLNGGTLIIPPFSSPRLINETITISRYRRSTDTDNGDPISPDPTKRRYGSIRITGVGTGSSGSVTEIVNGAFVNPCTLRYTGTGDGLFDIVSATNVTISELMLENASASAEYITLVRAYDQLDAATNITFQGITYSMTVPVTVAQHWQRDCKNVSHEGCAWLFGEDALGNLVPSILMGEDDGVNNTLIGGESILGSFTDCNAHGNVILRRCRNPSFQRFSFFPMRRIAGGGSSTFGSATFTFDGDKFVSGISLYDVCSTDNDGTETFFDATGATLASMFVIGGEIRNVDNGFILDGEGPWHIGTKFASVGDTDITVVSTAAGRLVDFSNHSGNEVDDQRNGLLSAASGVDYYESVHNGSAYRWATGDMNDDTAISFRPTDGSFIGLKASIVGNSPTASATAWLRAIGSASQAALESATTASIVDVSTVALAGTTGVDGRITISAVSTASNVGVIYLENRSGSTRNFKIFVEH